jgi:hypothetical protein
VDEAIAQLETLLAKQRDCTAALDAEIAQMKARLKALEVQRATLLEPYAFEVETLQCAIRVAVHEGTVPQVQSASFTCRRTEHVVWDDVGLQAYAVEQPSVLQCREVEVGTTWRWKRGHDAP